MPAVPAIIYGGSALVSAYMSSRAAKKASETAMQKTPEEQQAFTNNQRLAGQQVSQGNQMFGAAMPAVKQGLNYYGTLLGGNRAARVGAVGPEAESTSSAFQGADTAVGRGYVQGGQRDQALAENARAKAGAISRLTTGVRPMAAAGSSAIASSLIPAAQRGYGTAAGIYGGQGASEFANRQYGGQVGSQASGNFGRLFANLMATVSKGKNQGGGGLYPVGGGGGASTPGDDTGWG